jgi:hypothetical protein
VSCWFFISSVAKHLVYAFEQLRDDIFKVIPVLLCFGFIVSVLPARCVVKKCQFILLSVTTVFDVLPLIDNSNQNFVALVHQYKLYVNLRNTQTSEVL